MMIREALPTEAQAVLDLYHSVIDGMANSPYKPKWQKGIYPTMDDISSAINNKELYIALSEDNAVSGAVIGSEAIRLDTLPYNIPAQRLYESFGFQYRGEVELYYTVTGNTAYKMYEYLF